MFKTFYNIPVMPIQQVLGSPFGRSEHQLGPVWPEWDTQTDIRFKRNNILKDDVPQISDGEIFVYESQPIFWCGPIVDHFGHQIADFITRVMAYRSLGIEGRYAFSAPNNSQYNLNETPNFFKAIIDWLDIKEHLLLINRPVLAKSLVVVEQQEQLPNIGPSKKYLEELNKLIASKEIPKRRSNNVFVSRSSQAKGLIAGESYIEDVLSAHGYEIFKPENFELRAQLEKYLSSQNLVFSEGSALHTLQLLGSNIGKVHVIRRRPNYDMCKNFILPRAESVEYHALGGLVCGLRNNEPLLECGITIPSVEKLERFLSTLLGKAIQIDIELLNERIKNDLVKYYQGELESARAKIAGYNSSLLKAIKEAGYAEVINNE